MIKGPFRERGEGVQGKITERQKRKRKKEGIIESKIRNVPGFIIGAKCLSKEMNE